jgi:predicted permease
MMSSLVQDLRYATRALLQAPRTSALVIVMMALAIGAGTAVFSIVDQTVLRAAPFAHADRLVNVVSLVAKKGGGGSILTPMKIAGWQTQPSVFERFEAYTYRQFDVTGTAEPERIGGLDISTELLPMLGVSPQLGRGFIDGEGRSGGPRVALISDAIWRRRFGAARDILGRQIVLNDQPHTIVGVMPRRFRLIAEDESVWLPIDITASAGDNSAARFHGVARLRSGLDVARAQQDVDRIADHLQATTPIARSWYLLLEKKLVAHVDPTTRTALFVLLGAVAFVLLIACANVANLLLTNTVRRGREMAIKSALGAHRARLMRQVLLEGVLLATAGGALGILLAIWGLDALLAAAPDDLAFARTVPIEIDARVMAVTLVTSLVTGLLFAIIPAIRGSRPNLMPALHGVTPGNRDRASFGRIPSALVVAEVGFSLVLLVGAALMMRTLIKLETLNPGFDPRNVVSIELGLPTDRYPTVESRAAFFDELSRRFAASGRTRGMALAGGVPEGGHTWGTAAAEGSSRPPEEFESVINNVSPDYFRLLGIPLRAGRVFVNDDVPGAIVVSRALAERFWGSAGSAIGRRFRTSDKSPWNTVVGVAENVAGTIGEEGTSLLIYYPWPRRSTGTPSKPVPGRRNYARHILLVRADNALGAVPTIKSHIWALDKNQTIENVRLLEDIHAETFGRQRFVLWLMAAFAVVAVVMTVTGLFGVLAQAVAQRRREIGIRMALGASPDDMFKLIVLRGMMLTFGGVALGLLAAFSLSNVLAALLFEMSPRDPISFAGVALLFLVIAAVACWLPARAAMRVQPSSALRTE